MIAILDPRLATARYSGFLRASLPPYWTTYDPQIVRSAVGRVGRNGWPATESVCLTIRVTGRPSHG